MSACRIRAENHDPEESIGVRNNSPVSAVEVDSPLRPGSPALPASQEVRRRPTELKRDQTASGVFYRFEKG